MIINHRGRYALSRLRRAILVVLVCFLVSPLGGTETVEHPFSGITLVSREESSPRRLRMHVVQVDLSTPGIRFELTPPGGTLETVRRTTLEFLREKRAQLAINVHFFLPFPSTSPDADLIGLAAANGNIYSAFETPVQSYAIVANAPAINVDRTNRASLVHRDPEFADGKHIREAVLLWTAIAGSAQIVTDGVKTIPVYRDAEHPEGVLSNGGPGNYNNSRSWYDVLNARTAIGLTRDNRTLVLFTVDRANGSLGMTGGEVADILIRDYAVFNALNLDGGGSTTLAMENPSTHAVSLVNVPDESASGRSVGSSLAIFANPR